MGSDTSEAARALGRIRTQKKAEAVRENGKLGGNNADTPEKRAAVNAAISAGQAARWARIKAAQGDQAAAEEGGESHAE